MHRHLLDLKPIAAAVLVIAGVLTVTGMPAVSVAEFLLSSIGAGATVAPNEYNTAAEQIRMREAELDERERALTERESSLAKPVESRERALGILLVAAGTAMGIQHYRTRRLRSWYA